MPLSKPRYWKKYKKRDLMVRPSRVPPEKFVDTIERFYENNSGERFLVRTTDKGNSCHTISVSQVISEEGERLSTAAGCVLDDLGTSVRLSTTEKTHRLLRKGKPLEEFKHRFLFRIFLNEALRIARLNKRERITIETKRKGYKEYLHREFGFEFGKTPDEKGWWTGTLKPWKENKTQKPNQNKKNQKNN